MKKLAPLGLAMATAAMVLTLSVGCLPPGGGETRTAPPAPGATMDLVMPTGPASTSLSDAHFVTNWMLLGPFQFKEGDFGGDQQQAAVDKEFVPNEAALDGSQTPPAGAAWKIMQFTSSEGGLVDLDPVYGEAEHVAAYAVAWLDCPQDVPDAKLYVGSDDYMKVWINGRLVHTYKKERRAVERDQDIVGGVALKKGPNRIVVKCVDVVYGWSFYFRLTDAQGKPFLVKPRK